MALLARKRLAPLGLLPLALLTGCVTVDAPEPAVKRVLNPTASNQLVSYDAAMDYLQVTRRAYLDRARVLEGVDATTRAGVGLSVVGAGISATLEHHAAKKAGKFLTYGAASFIANKNIAPIEISRVYRAGATNLECIRAAAVVGAKDAAQINAELTARPKVLEDVTNAANALEAVVFDIQELVAKPPAPAKVVAPAAKPPAKKGVKAAKLEPEPETEAPEKVGDLLAPADQAINAVKEARKVVRAVTLFKTDAGLGERVLASVNGTRQVVNDLALSRTPDVEAILQSGAAFARFTSTGVGWIGDIKTARDSLTEAFDTAGKTQSVKKGGQVEILRNRLQAQELVLRAALAAVPDISLADDFAAIAQCQTAVGVYKPVTVSPNPIKATLGGDPVKLTLTGKAPFTGRDLPNNVAFDGTANPPLLKAGEKAEAGDHTIRFTDAWGVDSGGVTLTLEAKKAEVAKTDKPETSAAGGGAAPADTKQDKPIEPKTPVAGGPPPGPPVTEPPAPAKDDKAKADGKGGVA